MKLISMKRKKDFQRKVEKRKRDRRGKAKKKGEVDSVFGKNEKRSGYDQLITVETSEEKEKWEKKVARARSGKTELI